MDFKYAVFFILFYFISFMKKPVCVGNCHHFALHLKLVFAAFMSHLSQNIHSLQSYFSIADKGGILAVINVS